MRLSTLGIVKILALGLVVSVPLVSSWARADDGVRAIDTFRARMGKWVETRQILSEERADWLAERESLQATRNLLRSERKVLRAEIKEFEETGASTDEERRELLLERAELQRSAAALRTQVAELESIVQELAPQLPDPLQQKLELLLVQIPEDPDAANVPLGQRLINVLGVLSQTEKWNSTATFVGETRAVGSTDEKSLVRTLYWGLGQAFYVDAQGSVAGVGHPTGDGWAFTDVEGVAEDTTLLLDIYEGNVDTISFVPMPVEIR